MFQDIGVELADKEKLCNLDYADNPVCLLESAEHAQNALDRPVRTVAPFVMCLVSYLQDVKCRCETG